MPTVSVKWEGQVYEEIKIDVTERPYAFKQLLHQLTGVPSERQTIVLRGAILKDDSDWSKMAVEEGQRILMLGTLPEIGKAPEKRHVSMEDHPEKEQATAVVGHFSGLLNLGNTCYVNATMQCLHSISELKSALIEYPQAGKSIADSSHCLTDATRSLFIELDKSVTTVIPTQFLRVLRKDYPRFDEIDNGSYVQQDAEECLAHIVNTLSKSLSLLSPSVNIDAVKKIFAIDIVSSVTCEESGEETSERDSVFSLKCYITERINHLHEGLRLGLKSELRKLSPRLGRDADHIKNSRISGLPRYLTVHFLRHEWKRELNCKVKILKKVDFPLELDILDLCSDSLRKTLEAQRPMLRDDAGGNAVQGSSKSTSGEGGEQVTGIYDLAAVLTHQGKSADAGHYAAWVKQENGKWTLFDDDHVTEQGEEDIKNLAGDFCNWHMAYVCLYKARPITTCTGPSPSRVESTALPSTIGPEAQKLTLVGNPKKALKPFQLDGVEWLWYLHCKGKGGGILADEMGLGKTLQTCVFIVSLLKSSLIKKVLVIVPATLLGTWSSEFEELGVVVHIYHGREKDKQLNLFKKKKNGILITTYETCVQNEEFLPRGWSYLIVDEGHLIKNLDTQRSLCIRTIKSDHRLILTGTPIERSIDEIWSLLNFCMPAIFNDRKDFRKSRSEPLECKHFKIDNKQQRQSSRTIALEHLKADMKPYILRRLAADVLQLPKKHEFTVWLKLSGLQLHLYRRILKEAKTAISKATFAAIDILKKICDDPLLIQMADEPNVEADIQYSKSDLASKFLWSMIKKTVQEYTANTDFQSVKLQFLESFVRDMITNGHHVLIFAQRKHMLNQIEEILKPLQCGRLEGGRSLKKRADTVKVFQAGNIPILLIQSKVGSVGLTLTKADRVIIVDPAWNPSTDSQSICRAYRQGQKNQVMVYRLITSGTVEERIYKQQIQKMRFSKVALDIEDPYSYFTTEIEKSMFVEGNYDISETELALADLHEKPNSFVQSEIDALNELQHTTGVTYHSSLFSKVASQEDTKNLKVVFNPRHVRTHRNKEHQSLKFSEKSLLKSSKLGWNTKMQAEAGMKSSAFSSAGDHNWRKQSSHSSSPAYKTYPPKQRASRAQFVVRRTASSSALFELHSKVPKTSIQTNYSPNIPTSRGKGTQLQQESAGVKPPDGVKHQVYEQSNDRKLMNWCSDVLIEEKKTLDGLKRLQSISNKLPKEKVLLKIKYYLETIGSKIDQFVIDHEEDLNKRERMTTRLWNYVSTFSNLPGAQLHDLYLRIKQQKGTAAGVGPSSSNRHCGPK